MTSDPNRFTITDYAYDRDDLAALQGEGQALEKGDAGRDLGGYAESDVRPLVSAQNGIGQGIGDAYGAVYRQEVLKGHAKPSDGLHTSGRPDLSNAGIGSPHRVPPAASYELAKPLSPPPPSSSSSSTFTPSKSGLKPSISAKTSTTGYVPRKGKDAFPISPIEGSQGGLGIGVGTGGGAGAISSGALGGHQFQYPPTSPSPPIAAPAQIHTSSSFRRLPNIPSADQATTSTSASLAHSNPLTPSTAHPTVSSAFPAPHPLSPPSTSVSGGSYFPPSSSSAAAGTATHLSHAHNIDFSRPASDSASNLLSPPFLPLSSAGLSDTSSNGDREGYRPAYPCMPSPSTELPTLPSIGRSYRNGGGHMPLPDLGRSGSGSNVSSAGPRNWAEEGIEARGKDGYYGEEHGYGDHEHDDDVTEKGVEKDSSMKQLAYIDPATPRDLSWRRFFPKFWGCRLILFVVIFELVVDLTIEGNILYRFNTAVDEIEQGDPVYDERSTLIKENQRRLPIYLIIFGLAHLWQLVLTIISIRTKNTIQVSAVSLFNYAFLAWAVIQVDELGDILGGLNEKSLAVSGKNKLVVLPLNILTGVIIAVVGAGCLALSWLTWVIRKEFGWERYRFLGADPSIRKCYRNFQIFECLCYFSAFFCAGFGIQFIWLGTSIASWMPIAAMSCIAVLFIPFIAFLQPTDVEYIITYVALPVSLLVLIFGRLAAKYENKPCMILFLFGNLLGAAYFVFKVVRVWTGPSHSSTYRNTNKSLTVFAALSTLALGMLLVCGVVVYRGFGKGLKREICGKEFWRRYLLRKGKGGRGGRGKGGDGLDEVGGYGVEDRERKGRGDVKRLSID